jgi:hypothetical protein
MTKWDWLLIVFGVWILGITVPTILFDLVRLGRQGLPPVGVLFPITIGTILIVAGVFGRGWRARR